MKIFFFYQNMPFSKPRWIKAYLQTFVLLFVCVSVQMRNGYPILGKNMPAVAGNLKWSQELRERILSNRSKLSQLTHM